MKLSLLCIFLGVFTLPLLSMQKNHPEKSEQYISYKRLCQKLDEHNKGLLSYWNSVGNTEKPYIHPLSSVLYCANWLDDIPWLKMEEWELHPNINFLYESSLSLYHTYKDKLDRTPSAFLPIPFTNADGTDGSLTINIEPLISLLVKSKREQSIKESTGLYLNICPRTRELYSLFASQAALLDTKKIAYLVQALTLPQEIQAQIKKYLLQFLLKEAAHSYTYHSTYPRLIGDMVIEKDRLMLRRDLKNINNMAISFCLSSKNKKPLDLNQPIYFGLIAPYNADDSFSTDYHRKNIQLSFQNIITVASDTQITSLKSKNPYLIFTTSNGLLHIYSYEKRENLFNASLDASKETVSSAAFRLGNSIYIAEFVGPYVVGVSASRDLMYLFESKTGVLVKTLKNIPYFITALTALSDTLVLAGCTDTQRESHVCIFDITKDDCCEKLSYTSKDIITNIAVDHAKIVAGTNGGQIIIWDREFKEYLHTFAIPDNESVKKIQLSSCGVIAVLGVSGKLFFYKPARAISAQIPYDELMKLDLQTLALLPPFI